MIGSIAGLAAAFTLLASPGDGAGPPRPAADARLAALLDAWQARSLARTSLEVAYTRAERSPTWGTFEASGTLLLGRGGRALLEETGGSWAAWSGDSFAWYEAEPRRLMIVPIDEQDRGRLPAVVALPLLWGVSGERLTARYKVDLIGEADDAVVLAFAPLPQPGRADFSKAYVSLDRATYLPKSYRLEQADGTTNEYRVTRIAADPPTAEDRLRLARPAGWRVDEGPLVERSGFARLPRWLRRAFTPALLP